jgi:hypothetical protein
MAGVIAHGLNFPVGCFVEGHPDLEKHVGFHLSTLNVISASVEWLCMSQNIDICRKYQ